jgi:NCAIR mutase (PurE)-related protein
MSGRKKTIHPNPKSRHATLFPANVASNIKLLAGSSTFPVGGYAEIDLTRLDRTAIPEIIYCENKTVKQILAIAKSVYHHKKLVLGTRCPVEHFPSLRRAFPMGFFVPEARSFRIGHPLPDLRGLSVGIVSAGTTDIAACEEAALVRESLGVTTLRIYDVGVAGIHRLFSNDHRIKQCSVLIVAAGMEGALPSVVAGLYQQPVIAIPTSVGYGTALGGFTALFAMLTSCAPGVAVVNIDNGVGAAAAAFKILKLVKSKSA